MKKFDFCDIFLREDNIIQVNICPNVDIKADNVKTMVTTSLELTNNKEVPVIMFLGEFSTFSKEAREYSANPKNEVASTAIAYILSNLGHRLIINFYVKINKPIKPIKTFSNEKDAINWLNNYK